MILVEAGCKFLQELESMDIVYPSSMTEIHPGVDSALCFAIRHKAWLATFWACFALDSETKISNCSLSWDIVDNATVSDIPSIEQKGDMVWRIFKELFEKNR